MKTKTRIAILFGGRSAEHSVSILSARSIVESIDRSRFDLILIGIDRDGRWFLHTEQALSSLMKDVGEYRAEPVAPVRIESGLAFRKLRKEGEEDAVADLVFPVLHGPYGEDGTVQGMLDMFDAPYVGCGVLGSALCMDKDVQKRIFAAVGIPVVRWEAVKRLDWEREKNEVQKRIKHLGLPVFVKPANLGSSVGITKIESPGALNEAIEKAFAYDRKIIIEHGIDAREIECSVLGNEEPRASVPGEIVSGSSFYSYDAKYKSDSKARLLIPASLSDQLARKVQDLAIRSFQVAECAGMARVDFLLDRRTQELYVNELNTIPGFTSISMYPKLWEATGLPYAGLITRLIELAFERHGARSALAVI